MARITSYPVLSTVSSGDWIPITDTSVTGNPLKNVTVADLQSFIITGSTLQTVVAAGNTYQGSSGPLWTWSDTGLIAASAILSTTLSERSFKVTNLSNSSYTEIIPAQITIASASGNKTELVPNLSLASNVSLEFPLASGTLALVTDIPASPWVPVTGGINYPTNRVGINTALPQEALDVTGNAMISGKIEAPNFYGQLNGTISSTTTGITQASTDDSTKIATTAFVTNAVGAIPAGLIFKGEWDALTNTPNIGASTPDNGDFYIISVAGTTNLGGITDWEVGDWAIAVVSGGVTVWQKIDNSSVLTGTGTGTKIAKWDGAGTSVTLTDSAISEANGSVAINDLIALDTGLNVKKETIIQTNTFGITSNTSNFNTDPSINANVFGITSNATGGQTVGFASDIQAIKLKALHEGASSVAFVVGSNAKAEITNGGSVNANVYGEFSTATATGTNTSNNKYHIGSFVSSVIDNPNHTAVNFIGAYVDTNPADGTAEDMVVLQVNNQGVGAGTFNLTGDLTYLKITQGIMSAIGGTARAIHSEVTAPSLFLGSLESTGFIKTGGTATEFLMANGTVTSGSFTGNIPQNQITFGNASSNGITSSSSLKFSDTAKELFIAGTSAFGSAKITEDQVQIQFNAQLSAALALRNSIPEVRFTKGNINTYLQVATTPTQQNFISLPDKSGTVALLDDVVGTVTGTGNAGYIPLWSSTTALTDSAIFQNTANGRIGIGTATPFAQLETTEDILIADQVYIGTGDGPTQQNLRFGGGALVLNTSGILNTAIGNSTLTFATGSQNTALGAAALVATTTGEKNTGVGPQALYGNLTGNENVAIGPQSLYSNVLGSRNTAMGYEALYTNNSNDNTAIGYRALKSASNNMNNNVAIGNEAGRSGNATFYNNTLIGQQAGLNATTGNGAVVIGRQAARIAADGTGNVTNLTRSTIIGAFAYPLETTSQDEIVIGYGADGLGDNTTVIGTTVTTKTRLYGDIDAATGDVEVADNTKGLILSSPDGTRYRVTVANGGALTVTAV
jgi:hypothetical protein